MTVRHGKTTNPVAATISAPDRQECGQSVRASLAHSRGRRVSLPCTCRSSAP